MQDWYLITPNTRPNLTGGYENDAYNDYKDDEFAEILDTDIASTVELCLYLRSLQIQNYAENCTIPM